MQAEIERTENENGNPNQTHNSEFWNPIVKVVGWAIVALFILWQVCAATIDKEHQWQTFLQLAPNVLIVIAMGYHAYIYKRQWEAMQDSLKRTDTIMEHDREAFYLTNRAYLGIMTTFIEAEGGTSPNDATAVLEIPGDRRFRFVLTVQNSGKTPALNVGHVFRVSVITPPITEKPPEFRHISQSRTMPQMLPNDKPQYFRGSWLEFPAAAVQAIKNGDATLIVSCKFVFDTLGRQEEVLAHFVWMSDDKLFAARRDYPFTDADDAYSVYEDKI